ncbi:MAG: hypothetical protein H6625_00195 [Bdellovibrionaceae bacterium]|nr:hypothetical protein [Pseudobdellovibrionaceae bacterium]
MKAIICLVFLLIYVPKSWSDSGIRSELDYTRYAEYTAYKNSIDDFIKEVYNQSPNFFTTLHGHVMGT